MRYRWGFISLKRHLLAKEEEYFIFTEALARLGALVRNQKVFFLNSNLNLYICTFRHVSVNISPVLPKHNSLCSLNTNCKAPCGIKSSAQLSVTTFLSPLGSRQSWWKRLLADLRLLNAELWSRKSCQWTAEGLCCSCWSCSEKDSVCWG